VQAKSEHARPLVCGQDSVILENFTLFCIFNNEICLYGSSPDATEQCLCKLHIFYKYRGKNSGAARSMNSSQLRARTHCCCVGTLAQATMYGTGSNVFMNTRGNMGGFDRSMMLRQRGMQMPLAATRGSPTSVTVMRRFHLERLVDNLYDILEYVQGKAPTVSFRFTRPFFSTLLTCNEFVCAGRMPRQLSIAVRSKRWGDKRYGNGGVPPKVQPHALMVMLRTCTHFATAVSRCHASQTTMGEAPG